MEGRGPVHGSLVEMEAIIAGRDVVATDATASRVMGFDPKKIWYIRMAHEAGLGEIENIDIVEERLDAVARAFKRP